jgi:hypothetical protein
MYFGCVIYWFSNYVLEFLKDIGVDGKIILKWILNKVARVWSGLVDSG